MGEKDLYKSRNYPWTGRSLAGLFGEKLFYHFSNFYGRGLTYGAVALAVPFFLALRKRERKASFDFFSRVYRTSNTLKLLIHTYIQFWLWGACWVDRSLIFGRGFNRYLFHTFGENNLQEGLSKKRGLILLTSHMGNYSIGGWLLKRQRGHPVNIALIDDEERQVRRFLNQIQGCSSPRIISISHSFFSSISILKALREGEIVGIQVDRVVSKNATAVNFFGSRTIFPKGPFLLSIISGAPISISFTIKRGWKRYWIFAESPLDPPNLTVEMESVIQEMAQKVAERIEEIVRMFPHQWFNFYPYWIDSPGFVDTFGNLECLER